MTPYTLRSDGDPLEKRCDALFIARDFPSYEVFWQKFVTPISRRPIDTGFLTDFQLARELKTAQDVCIAQLHYSVLLHLARAYDLMQLEIPGSTELLFGLTALGGAQDAAFELLERFQHRHKYAAWPRMKSGVLHDAGLDAQRNWRQSHGHPLESLRSYRDRLLHGRIPPGIAVTDTAGNIVAYRLPRIGKESAYFDWRAVAPASTDPQPPPDDFADAGTILTEAWTATTRYLEDSWKICLLPHLK